MAKVILSAEERMREFSRLESLRGKNEEWVSLSVVADKIRRPIAYVQRMADQGMLTLFGRRMTTVSYARDWLERNPNPYAGRRAEIRNRSR